MRPDPFVCPHCLGHLTEASITLACRSCAQTFPLWHGVPNFGAKTDYYYGEFPQAVMRSIIETAAKQGSAKAFEDALRDKTDDWRRYFLHYATDETRAAWQFLLRLPENASVLDMGCGWGNLAISLARNFATVYAMDLVPERAVISSIRAREAGLHNIRALVGGNTKQLPFPDSSLDAVILNGVLEWAATSFPNIDDPRQAQLHVLREIVRVLKPEGQVYIGIENRLGFLYFLGRPDEHSKLKFATLLPRRVANRYSLAKRGQPYRTYTYTWRGYRKLLREAGLPDARFYCPFPEYREFSELIDLDRPPDLARALHPTSLSGRLGLQVCKRVNLLREFSPSYSIVASKAPGVERFVDRLLRHINVATGKDLYLHVTRTATALLFTSEIVVRLPLTARAQMRMNTESTNLKEIRSGQGSLIPETVAEGEFQGQGYLAIPVFRGVPGVKLARHQRNRNAVVQQATDFISDFHQLTCREQICTEEWIQKSFDWLVDYVWALGEDVSELKKLCRRDLLGKRVLNVTAHGDFSLQNLVFDPRSSKLTGVVDWDLADFNGWPARDLLHLFVALEYETHGSTFNEAVLAVLKRLGDGRSFEGPLFNSYLGALHPEPEQVVWAAQRYILRNIYDKNEYGDRKITPLLAGLNAELSAVRALVREWLTHHPSSTRRPSHVNDFSVSPSRLEELARELAVFSGSPIDLVSVRLAEELARLGGRMAQEWHKHRPLTARQIERFYKQTDAYLYELLIDGENPFRALTRDAILQALREQHVKQVFEFGGGIGTDAMWFARAGFRWVYFDLPGGRTFGFATWRFAKSTLPITTVAEPRQSSNNDAVISVEVFEHLPNLFSALRAINRTLRPGGLLIFTESFGKTDRHPQHLARAAIQGRFLDELIRAAGFEPLRRFGPEDCLYRTTKRREPQWYDACLAIGLVFTRVARKVPGRIARLLSKQRRAA